MAYLRNINDPGVFCDSTVFSDFSTSSSESFELMTPDSSQAVEAKRTLPRGLKAEGLFPLLPSCINFSTLGNPQFFNAYIEAEFPLAFQDELETTATTNNSNMPPPPRQSAVKLRRTDNG
ncbi:hypothetical protein HYPSUDRAFT_206922 [Hypholoma sublateritium FD-334 SS-4]|uniref:Uncharacterized protein n=1 Tax=Hypholoma sublateritium (strain FD-334 SS-4) TaxID=945553 RepID=A0A0D2P8I7_HYPSF|nr:hypothetical protein HYPSUDRAFT_206922 [Hypholoma sublateritium FD-334 SS-4]